MMHIYCACAAICSTVINVYGYDFGSLRKNKLHLVFFSFFNRGWEKCKALEKMFHTK